MHIHVCSLLKYKMHLNLHQYALELNSKCKHSLSPMWMPVARRQRSLHVDLTVSVISLPRQLASPTSRSDAAEEQLATGSSVRSAPRRSIRKETFMLHVALLLGRQQQCFAPFPPSLGPFCKAKEKQDSGRRRRRPRRRPCRLPAGRSSSCRRPQRRSVPSPACQVIIIIYIKENYN
jgi:hypothetical protein